MNVQQILDEIQEKYPHSLSDASVMRKLDEIQKELFRTIYKPVVIDVYDIISDSEFYTLGYSNTKVIDVSVNGVEYTEANIKGASPSSGQFYYFIGDTVLGLYPTPTTDITDGLVITRYKVPQLLETTASIPDFDYEFHMMLVYYACKIIAENYKDFDTANGFMSQYQALLKSFNMSKQQTQDYYIQNVYGRLV